jgi:hypothetical protein
LMLTLVLTSDALAKVNVSTAASLMAGIETWYTKVVARE